MLRRGTPRWSNHHFFPAARLIGILKRFETQLASSSSVCDNELRREKQELETQLSKLRVKEAELKRFLKRKSEEEVQKKASEDLELATRATEDEIAALEQDITPGQPRPRLGAALFKTPDPKLPKSIRDKIESVALVQSLDNVWSSKIHQLQAANGFKNIPVGDIEKFLSLMPVSERARNVTALQHMVRDAGVSTQYIADSLMAAYAANGSFEDVERLLAQCSNPTIYSFGHVAKAHFKAKNFGEVAKTLERMQKIGLEPTLPIYTTVVQAFIQARDYGGARKIFDNLKYMSTTTQPDVKLYNALILTAAKEHNVNRALDLYNEMRTRPIDPLEPNQETLNILVYACARDDATHYKAWEFFMQLRESGMTLGRESLNALLYLCGTTGELLMARAIIKQLCSRQETYPTDFAINCLFLAYLNFKPNQPSPVVATKLGSRVREQLLKDTNTSVGSTTMPPFLPVNSFTPHLVVLEATALINFFLDTNKQLLQVQSRASASAGEYPAVLNYFRMLVHHGTFQEFRQEYDRLTYFGAHEDTPQEIIVECDDERPLVERDAQLYILALKACAKFKDLDFARTVWTERGKWRKTEGFRQLPKARRDKSDITFAIEMVAVLAECGEVNDALQLVLSTTKQIRWRRTHLDRLLEVCAEHEDFDTILKIKHILRGYYEKEQALLSRPKRRT